MVGMGRGMRRGVRGGGGEELLVAGGAEEVAGVEVAFAPGFFGGLGELPVVEAGSEAGGDGLGVLGAVVVSESVVGEAEGFGEEPAFAVVLGKEGGDAGVPVAVVFADFCFEVVEGDQRQHRVAQLGIFVFVDAPETFGVRLIL